MRATVLAAALALLAVACAPNDPANATLIVTLTAGPICPVVTDPPDPACADRPVAGALVVVEEAGGGEVARGTSGADGKVRFALASGSYRVVAQPVEGLLGVAEAVDVIVAGTGPAVEVTLAYDTGIR